MSNKNRRGGLGRGLGSLIPTAPPARETVAASPADVPGSLPSGADADHRDTAQPPTTQPADSTDAPTSEAPAAGAPDAGASDAVDDPTAPLPVPGASFRELPIDSVRANAKQPRQVFDEEALGELTHSIREFGVLQPVVVRPADGADEATATEFELIMGERRLRAATAAGLDVIPAIVRSTSDDAMLRDALLENIHRAQLNPLEEAAAYQQLLEEFGTTHDELAQRIGRSRPQVSNTIRLLNLPVPVQRRVAAGILSAGHARALLSLDDPSAQDELAARIVAEGLSVRATEELVQLARQQKVPAKRVSRPKLSAPGVTELAANLSDLYDTRVRVDLGRRKGRITVEFGSIDDLERLVALMAPQLSSERRRQDPNAP
ncbi:ParB/RepB/Spo0J family partition protein [Jatrophihabitans fulvus]